MTDLVSVQLTREEAEVFTSNPPKGDAPLAAYERYASRRNAVEIQIRKRLRTALEGSGDVVVIEGEAAYWDDYPGGAPASFNIFVDVEKDKRCIEIHGDEDWICSIPNDGPVEITIRQIGGES